MQLAVRPPFSFARTLDFLRSFPPCQGDFVLGADSLAGALALGDRAVSFTVRADLSLETDAPEVAVAVADLLGARDDLAPFYAAAAGDRAFAPLVARLHGLHHVRFRSLEEITVYSVLMQRTPVALAARLKRRFLDAFGLRAGALRVMPSFARLRALDAGAIADAIGHRRKAASIVEVVRGVATIDPDLLRHGRYCDARDALLAIRGIGPFSAGAILLRGLGRMDDLPGMRWFADEARAVYGAAFDERAVRARYGRHLGYWAFYLKSRDLDVPPS
jgi:DNA-3-methyladenine glycosylase II